MGGSESVKILGFCVVLCIRQLVFALCHHLISKKKKQKMPKGCLMVMADPLDLGNGKGTIRQSTKKVLSTFLQGGK